MWTVKVYNFYLFFLQYKKHNKYVLKYHKWKSKKFGEFVIICMLGGVALRSYKEKLEELKNIVSLKWLLNFIHCEFKILKILKFGLLKPADTLKE